MKTNLIGISGKIGSGKDTVGDIIQYLDWEKTNGKCEKEFNEILPNGIFVPKGMRSFTSVFNESNYQIKKYADKLKDIVCLLIGCTRADLEDHSFKEKELGEEWNKLDKIALMAYNKDNPLCHEKGYLYDTMTPRKLLQLLGTECGRQIIHPNIWVNALFVDYKSDDGRVIEPISKENRDKYPIGFAPAKQVYFRNPQFPNWIITDVRFPNEAKAIKDRGGVVIRVNRDSEQALIDKGIHIPKHLRTKEHPSETALDDYDFDHVIENGGSIEELVEKVKQLNLV